VHNVFQFYNWAVENWCNQLGHLIKLEEDITAILCDRETLSVLTFSVPALC
jgi:hypothetical protein